MKYLYVSIVFFISLAHGCAGSNIKNDYNRKDTKVFTQDDDSLLIRRNYNSEICDSYFVISSTIEKDSFYSKMLSSYIYMALIDNKTKCPIMSEVNIVKLYKRPSFIKSILYIYNESTFKKYSIYEDKSRWVESYDYLLYNIKDKEVLWRVTDSLLSYRISNGLFSIWEEEYTAKLNNINSYTDYVIQSKEYYKLVELLVFFHNHKQLEKEEKILKILDSYQKESKTTNKAKSLLKEYKIVPREEYQEVIYGGY